MKIVIEELGDTLAVSFTGKGKRFDQIKLLAMATTETVVDALVSNLTDAQLQDAAEAFAEDMKKAIIARYKMNPSGRKEVEDDVAADMLEVEKPFGLIAVKSSHQSHIAMIVYWIAAAHNRYILQSDRILDVALD